MPDIDQAFVEEYNAQVHLDYRQMGSRLQNMTRKGTVQAKSVHWQRFGHLTTQTKARRAQHTFQTPDHNTVTASMTDHYVPTMVDDLDLLKLNIDEKNSHVRAQVARARSSASSRRASAWAKVASAAMWIGRMWNSPPIRAVATAMVWRFMTGRGSALSPTATLTARAMRSWSSRAPATT
ncbi:phage capsid protein [Fertoeibacter niger]|uniref:phage capsid protein n=1 Tax=Fertoeibacter niger TaxID=2656921 RepID=UPI00128B90D5|nr:phage capsid protein [Fertoeibacter niger]